jgi:hypothetical protein
MVKINHYLFAFILFCSANMCLHAQNNSQPNILDAQYRVINSEKYPMMTSDMKGFDADRNNFLFIDLTYNSIFRGLIQCGYERKINSKNTMSVLFGITFLPDPLAWQFNNTDIYFVKNKGRLSNAIHNKTWCVGLAESNNAPGPMLGFEHSYGLNEDVLHGFSFKSGAMYYNYSAYMNQSLTFLINGMKKEEIETKLKARIDYGQIYCGLSYKKLVKQGAYFDGGINVGFKMIRYNIKVKRLSDIYQTSAATVTNQNNYYDYGYLAPSDEVFIADPTGRVPFQFTPTILFHGRLGFGFNTKKSRRLK